MRSRYVATKLFRINFAQTFFPPTMTNSLELNCSLVRCTVTNMRNNALNDLSNNNGQASKFYLNWYRYLFYIWVVSACLWTTTISHTTTGYALRPVRVLRVQPTTATTTVRRFYDQRVANQQVENFLNITSLQIKPT